jgi:Xaa-Pro aminopeptidase
VITASDEVGVKLDRVRSWLERSRASGVLLSSQAGFAWITAGGRSHISIGESTGVASVLVTPNDACVITTNIELRRILDEEIGGLPIETVEYPWHRSGGQREVVDRLCNGDRAVADVADGDLAAAGPDLDELRYTMLPPEVERYQGLGRDAAAAVEAACRAAEPGESELDVAARLSFECYRQDILPLVNLVAAGERIPRYRHPIPTTNRVDRTLLVALTGRRHGLHASLTRMVSFGGSDAELASRHEAVTRVDATEILTSLPGTSLGAVVQRAIDQYESEGFPGEWELHHQGGLTGYAGREIFGTPETDYRLQANQVVAWNPSITRVKSEDTVLVTDEGIEVLTSTGAWPSRQVEVEAGTLERPALLVKS